MKCNVNALRTFLRIYSVLSIVLFCGLLSGFLLRWPELRQDGGSFHWLIWDDITGHVGPMLFVIYIVWAVFLFLAAGDPRRYASFLDFTIAANLAHAVIMIRYAIGEHQYHSKFLTDIPWILLLSGALLFWRPSYVTPASKADSVI